MRQEFVSREAELNQLNTFLTQTLSGQTQVCFISGEAGTGKSRLIEEFVRQSENRHENLLFTQSNCNAQTGFSDPYLPFKIILGMLIGENTNSITKNNEQRLSSILRVSGRLLVDIAPDLIGTLIPGMNILASLARFSAREKGMLTNLEERAIAVDRNPSDIEQFQIFLQYTALLRQLSQECPLVVIIDDLQWVDAASNALFFHLVRELRTCRILFVGLYRPNDVAAGRNHQRHPLQPTLNEIKRLYGNVYIDLDKTTQNNGKIFVDALINSQPNKLSKKFRNALFKRTGGHALFTKELLRSMQERGDLIQDPEGRWHESTQLNWDQVPAKVEGIIEERVGRLPAEFREILNIACVEGQEFTVGIIAKIKNLKEQELVQKIHDELECRHYLVQELNEIKLTDNTFLSRYSFIHALFQSYLYSCLSRTRRRMLHAEVAKILKTFYSDRPEVIAVQLAYHYTQARQTEKAATYLQLAGEQAVKLGEFNQGRTFFNQALAEISGKKNDPALNQAQLEWWIGETYYYQGLYSNSETHYRASIQIARQLGDKKTITQGLISLAQSLRRRYASEEAMTAAEEALTLANKTGNRSQQGDALRVLGIIYGQVNRNNERLNYYQEALQIADEINDMIQKMMCLNSIGVVYGEVFGDSPQAIKYYQKALALAKKHYRMTGQAIYSHNLAVAYRNIGNYQEANNYIDEHLKIANQISNTEYTSVAYENFGIILLHTDPQNVYLAIEQWLKSIEIADEYSRIDTQVDSRNLLLISYLVTDQLEQAMAVIEQTKPLLLKYTANKQVCSETILEAITYLRCKQLDEANYLFQDAKDTAHEKLYSQRWAYRYHRAFAQAGIALLVSPKFRSRALTKATEYFGDAVNNCGWLGILNDALIILRQMQKADPDGILQPLAQELINKREIAWKNRP
jgi:predicted ATPase